MFGKSKPVVFEPYGRRRSRRRLPGWLLLLLLGTALGAGAVVYVQERHLPPRLSAKASAQLRTSFEQAEQERQRLAGELAAASQRLEAALADKQGLAEQLAAAQRTAEGLRKDVAAVVASLPPDPRGGAIEVRAARFSVEDGALAYDVVLTRDGAAERKPFTGVMQLVVAGESTRGAETTVRLEPVAVTVGAHEAVRGRLPLPEGFTPRQTTVNVRDRADGKLLGMRVMHVK